MLLAYSVLGTVFKDTEYTVVPEHIKTDCIAKTAAEMPSDHPEVRYYYINDRDTRTIIIEKQGGGSYEVTIDNEKYICEEWSLMLGRLWKVYIKDGNIVAWEGDFYSEPTINTVIRLEKTADSSLIKIPEGAKKHAMND